MSFTPEEMAAAGLPPLTLPLPQYWIAKGPRASVKMTHEGLLRLGLEHPEKAGEVFGDGWEFDGSRFCWGADDFSLWSWLRVSPDCSVPLIGSQPEDQPIPIGLEAAISVARKIAKAWEGIQP